MTGHAQHSRRGTAESCRDSQAGFSLLEALVVAGIMVVMSTAVVMQYRAAQELLDADAALAEVTSQMRYARQIAIDQRRNVDITFTNNVDIQVLRWDDSVNTTLMSDVSLPDGYTFSMPESAPDTPDGFGNDDAVDFGEDGVVGGTFLADGTFVDASNSILNGTVFTMGGSSGTARVATVSGATGRTKRYEWVDSAWVAQ